MLLRSSPRPSGSSARLGVFGLLFVLGSVSGCAGDPPPPATEILETFTAGTFKPEVLVALPVGPSLEEQERLMVGYLRDRYLVGGQTVEVLWVRRAVSGGELPALDQLPRYDANPVIFIEDHLDGWGWAHFDARAREWSLVDRTAPLPEETVQFREGEYSPPEGLPDADVEDEPLL